MARYPGATWRPVRDTGTDPGITPIGVILHVDAMDSPSLFRYFDGPSGGVESHLHIPRTPAYAIEQYRDTEQEADANYRGNSWVSGGTRYGFISVETQGYGGGEWTPYQLDEIVAFIRWAADEHGFPLRLAESYRSPGIGWHVMWGSGRGTNSWSNAPGKSCPGPRRIAQIHDVLLPRLSGSHDYLKPKLPEVIPTEDPDMPVLARGTAPQVYLTDLGTWKRWVKSGATVDRLRRNGVRLSEGAEYDSILTPLPEGEPIA